MSTQVTTRIDRPVGDDVPQYGKGSIFAVFAAVTVTMSVLGWGIAPRLADHLSTRDPFIDSLLICFDLGLVLMLALVLVLVRRERGSLSSRTSGRATATGAEEPEDRAAGRPGVVVGLPFTLLSAAINALPLDPDGPIPRDLPLALETQRVADYFHANWSGFALLVANALLAPVVEEIVFRGFLLPRSQRAFGRGDIWVNGRCSRSTTCTSRGACRKCCSTGRSRRPTPPAGSAARGSPWLAHRAELPDHRRRAVHGAVRVHARFGVSACLPWRGWPRWRSRPGRVSARRGRIEATRATSECLPSRGQPGTPAP